MKKKGITFWIEVLSTFGESFSNFSIYLLPSLIFSSGIYGLLGFLVAFIAFIFLTRVCPLQGREKRNFSFYIEIQSVYGSFTFFQFEWFRWLEVWFTKITIIFLVIIYLMEGNFFIRENWFVFFSLILSGSVIGYNFLGSLNFNRLVNFFLFVGPIVFLFLYGLTHEDIYEDITIQYTSSLFFFDSSLLATYAFSWWAFFEDEGTKQNLSQTEKEFSLRVNVWGKSLLFFFYFIFFLFIILVLSVSILQKSITSVLDVANFFLGKSGIVSIKVILLISVLFSINTRFSLSDELFKNLVSKRIFSSKVVGDEKNYAKENFTLLIIILFFVFIFSSYNLTTLLKISLCTTILFMVMRNIFLSFAVFLLKVKNEKEKITKVDILNSILAFIFCILVFLGVNLESILLLTFFTCLGIPLFFVREWVTSDSNY